LTQKIIPTQREIVMRDNDFIVTKTDAIGRLTYCNPIFIEFSGYTEKELLGQQHNIVRHPDMPRTVFSMLWQTILAGEDFFGYVKNICKDGSYYWVYATVTPSYGIVESGLSSEIIGFFSVRRKPDKAKLQYVEELYREMLAAEKKVNRHEAIDAGMEVLNSRLLKTGKDYREFILTL